MGANGLFWVAGELGFWGVMAIADEVGIFGIMAGARFDLGF